MCCAARRAACAPDRDMSRVPPAPPGQTIAKKSKEEKAPRAPSAYNLFMKSEMCVHKRAGGRGERVWGLQRLPQWQPD